MKLPGPKTQRLVNLAVLFLILVSVLWLIIHRQNAVSALAPPVVLTDSAAGLTVALPAIYQRYQPKIQSSDAGFIANYIRTNPAGFLTLRYDTGLTAVTNLLHRGMIEHIEAEIAQFFPVKYGSSYRSIATTHIQVAGHESIDHRFSYTTANGKQFMVRLIAVPYTNDVAYYLLLQAAPDQFDAIQSDLDPIKDSLELSGPKPQSRAS